VEAFQPNITLHISPENQIQLEKSGNALGREDPAGGTHMRIKSYNRLLIIDLFSYNSSRLEGNTYSYWIRSDFFRRSSAEGKVRRRKIMILNHKEAIVIWW